MYASSFQGWNREGIRSVRVDVVVAVYRVGTHTGRREGREMDWKLELVQVPVSDVDRAKAFYTEQVGFNADHDHQVSDEIRFVQLTPPGSACSIALGSGLSEMPPGSAQGLQMVVADVQAGRAELAE